MKSKKTYYLLCAIFLLTATYSFSQAVIENVSLINAPSLSASETKLPIYDQIEIGIEVFEQYENQFAPGGNRNPFSENDIRIYAELWQAGNKMRTFEAFYFRDYQRDIDGELIRSAVDDMPIEQLPLTSFPFRIRFTLEKIGNYTLIVKSQNQRNNPEIFQTYNIIGESNATENKGHLKFNGSYLGYASDLNSTLFLSGNGLTYYKYASRSDAGRARTENGFGGIFPSGSHFDYSPETIKDLRHFLDQLESNGANHIRLMLNSFNFDIEWDWKWDASTGTEGIKYHDYLYRAADMDLILEMCRKRGIYLRLCLLNHKNTSKPGGGGGHAIYNWENNPYNSIPAVNEDYDFFLNSNAIELFDRKIRYLMSRWGYHPNLAFVEITNELDHASDSYYGDFRTEINKWNADRAKKVKQYAPLKLVSTSPAALFVGNTLFDNPDYSFDYSIYHLYSDQRNASHHHSTASEFYKNKFKMPFVCGELGVAGSGICGHVNDSQPHNTVLHNNIWSTSFSGAFSSGMIYFFEEVHNWPNSGQAIQHYLPLRTFFEGENLNAQNWESISTTCRDDPNRSDSANDCTPSNWSNGDEIRNYRLDGIKIKNNEGNEINDVEAYALKSNDLILGWVHNLDSYFFNLPDNDSCPDEGINVPTISGGLMQINNLICDDEYFIEWWNTHPWYDANRNDLDDDFDGGKISKPFIDEETNGPFLETNYKVDTYGNLNIKLPTLAPLAEIGSEDWAPDYAFKIKRTSSGNTVSNENLLKCYPNPVTKNKLTIKYASIESGEIEIDVYNSIGKLIEKVHKSSNEVPGQRSIIRIETKDYQSGVYIITLKGNRKIISSKKVVIIK